MLESLSVRALIKSSLFMEVLLILLILLLPSLLFSQDPRMGIVIRDSTSLATWITRAEADTDTEWKFIISDSISYKLDDTIPSNSYLEFNRDG